MLIKGISIVILFSFCLACIAEARGALRQYDKDAQLIYKPKGKPLITKLTRESGYCCLVLDITKQGDVKNIRINFCTHDELEQPIVSRVKEFRFSPALIDNKPVFRKNKSYNQDYYRFKGKYTSPIPGPNGYMEVTNPGLETPPRPQSREEFDSWIGKYFDTEMVCLPLVS